MKKIDYFLRIATLIIFLAALLFPKTKGEIIAVCGLFFATGLWALLYPSGPIGWAKTAYPQLDPQDDRLWAIPRLIGVVFIVISIFTGLAVLSH